VNEAPPGDEASAGRDGAEVRGAGAIAASSASRSRSPEVEVGSGAAARGSGTSVPERMARLMSTLRTRQYLSSSSSFGSRPSGLDSASVCIACQGG
jgi:hypothetical protein